MTLALQIGVGVWLGFMFTIATVSAFFVIAERVSQNRRYGRPWWRLRAS